MEVIMLEKMVEISTAELNALKREAEKKRCTNCGKRKLKTEFNKDKSREDELGVWCKECDNKYHKERRKNNREKVIEQEREASRKWRRKVLLVNDKHFHIIKRDHPKEGRCELCNKNKTSKGKPLILAYHHWDDKDLIEGNFVKGVWVCSHWCHMGCEAVDASPNIFTSRKYLKLKKQVEKEQQEFDREVSSQ